MRERGVQMGGSENYNVRVLLHRARAQKVHVGYFIVPAISAGLHERLGLPISHPTDHEQVPIADRPHRVPQTNRGAMQYAHTY